MLRGLVAAAFVVMVAACATAPSVVPERATIDTADAPFSIAGRISARRGDAGVAGSFTWVHDASHDTIDLSTPLGQTLAKLEGNREA